MNKKSLNKVICFVLLTALIFTLPPVIYAEAAEDVYVNDANNKLDGTIDGAYAIGGGGGTEQVGQSPAWAITGSGAVEKVGEIPPTPTPTPSPTPTSTPTSPPVVVSNTTMYIGLAYNTGAMDAATISNVVGSGFDLGFYDANRNFIKVGSTAETQLTMVRDTNVSLTAGTVGCYHILRPGTYTSFDAAKSAASAFSDGFPAYYNNTYYVLVGSYTTKAAAEAAITSRGISGSAYSASQYCVVVTKTGTTKILFEFDYGATFSLAARPISSSAKAQTKFTKTGYTYYGSFQFRRLHLGDGYDGKLTVTNVLDVEDYVKGVVPYEMSPSWPLEALKAQAISARTYAISRKNYHGKYGFDTCTGTDCQVYNGVNGMNTNTNTAVDSTKGMYVSYQGKLCTTLYHSADGGGTEDNLNVNGYEYAYLKGVIDPYEASATENPNKSWSVTFTGEELRQKISSSGLSTIVALTPKYSATGNVIELTFTDVNGRTHTVYRDKCRTTLGSGNTKSIHYTVQKTSDGKFYIKGSGWGHNVGMSQWGAYAMAKYHGKTAAEILTFYYTGVTVG